MDPLLNRGLEWGVVPMGENFVIPHYDTSYQQHNDINQIFADSRDHKNKIYLFACLSHLYSPDSY